MLRLPGETLAGGIVMPFELLGDVGGNFAYLPAVPAGRVDWIVVAGGQEVNGINCVITTRSPEGIVGEISTVEVRPHLERELPLPERYQLGIEVRGPGIPFLQLRGWWIRVEAAPRPGSAARARR